MSLISTQSNDNLIKSFNISTSYTPSAKTASAAPASSSAAPAKTSPDDEELTELAQKVLYSFSPEVRAKIMVDLVESLKLKPLQGKDQLTELTLRIINIGLTNEAGKQKISVLFQALLKKRLNV